MYTIGLIFIKYINTLRAKLLYCYTIKISIVKSHWSGLIVSVAIEQAFTMGRSRGGLGWLLWKQMDQNPHFFLQQYGRFCLERLCMVAWGFHRDKQRWYLTNMHRDFECWYWNLPLIDTHVSKFLWRPASFLISTEDNEKGHMTVLDTVNMKNWVKKTRDYHVRKLLGFSGYPLEVLASWWVFIVRQF